MCSVPSGETRLPGVPRFSSATERGASAASAFPPLASSAPPGSAPASRVTSITESARSAVTAAAAALRSGPATTSTGRSRSPRTSAPGANAAARDAAAGIHSRALPFSASRRPSSGAASGPAASRSRAVHGFCSGPPSAIRTSGRLESRSMEPYRGPSGHEQVAVTPCPARAATRSRRATDRPLREKAGCCAAGEAGRITSATPSACSRRAPPGSRQPARAVEPSPNHSWAGLSSVKGCSATSATALPNDRPTTAVAPW